MLASWRERGWPGPPTTENAEVLHVGQLWAALDDLPLAQQVTGFEVGEVEMEGLMLRLGMAKGFWVKRWREEARRGE